MKKVTAILAFVLAASACEQNPTKKIDDRFKDAPSTDSGDHRDKAIDSPNILVDGPSAVTFVEERENHFSVQVRSLLPEFDVTKMMIVNAEEFPGATLVDGTFSWTPSLGSAGTGTERETKLVIAGFSSQSKKPNFGWLKAERTIPITITREIHAPTIVIQGLPESTRENRNVYFHIFVETGDPQTAPPTLQFKPPPRNRFIESIANLVKVDKQVYDPATKTWDFTILMETDSELTNRSNDFGFTVQALSPLGHSSAVVEAQLKIFTSITMPTSSWDNSKSYAPQTKYTVPFLIYDPKGETNLSIVKYEDNEGVTIACDKQSWAVIECTMEFTTPQLAPGQKSSERTLKIFVENRNVDTKDAEVRSTTMTFDILTEAP